MRTLIAFEFKKLMSRKIAWAALGLALVLFALVNWFTIRSYVPGGYAQGVRDVYRQYEGQVITEELQAQMRRDFDGYMASYPDHFALRAIKEGEPGETNVYFPSEDATNYDQGVWQAYGDLTGTASLEDEEKRIRDAKELLAAGKDEQGAPLSASTRRYWEEAIQTGVLEPVVHYAKGWLAFFQDEMPSGILAIVVPGIALLALFGGEAASHMEAIFLTSRGRRQAVWAKLSAAGMVALAGGLLFFGLHFAVRAVTWGLDGARLPVGALKPGYGNETLPVVVAFGRSMLVLMLAAVACGAVVAWASARFRRALPAMLAVVAVLGGIDVLWAWGRTLMGQFYGTQLYNIIGRTLQFLPPNALIMTYPLAAYVADAGSFLQLLLFPAALTGLLGWLTYRTFLRRRRV